MEKTKETNADAIKTATRKWINQFNDIPQMIVVKLYRAGDEVVEITPSAVPEGDEFLPMWSTMWSFSNNIDNSWLNNKANLQAMADCGFRIYQQEDYDYIFGIDGAGYDFYEAHWIPLYKARGLKWHLI